MCCASEAKYSQGREAGAPCAAGSPGWRTCVVRWGCDDAMGGLCSAPVLAHAATDASNAVTWGASDPRALALNEREHVLTLEQMGPGLRVVWCRYPGVYAGLLTICGCEGPRGGIGVTERHRRARTPIARTLSSKNWPATFVYAYGTCVDGRVEADSNPPEEHGLYGRSGRHHSLDMGSA